MPSTPVGRSLPPQPSVPRQTLGKLRPTLQGGRWRQTGEGPTSQALSLVGRSLSWPLGHSPGSRQAGRRQEGVGLVPSLAPEHRLSWGSRGREGEEGSGAHWGRFIPEGPEASICWVRKLGERRTVPKKSRQRRKHYIAGAGGRSWTGVGSSRMSRDKQSKL